MTSDMDSIEDDVHELAERVRCLETSAAERSGLVEEVRALRERSHAMANTIQSLMDLRDGLGPLRDGLASLQKDFLEFKGKVLGAAAAGIFITPLLTVAVLKFVGK